jgi:hypothetical protein
VGLVALGTTAVTGLLALGADSDMDEARAAAGRGEPVDLAELGDTASRGKTLATVADVALGVGVVALGVAIVWAVSAGGGGDEDATVSFDGRRLVVTFYGVDLLRTGGSRSHARAPVQPLVPARSSSSQLAERGKDTDASRHTGRSWGGPYGRPPPLWGLPALSIRGKFGATAGKRKYDRRGCLRAAFVALLGSIVLVVGAAAQPVPRLRLESARRIGSV